MCLYITTSSVNRTWSMREHLKMSAGRFSVKFLNWHISGSISFEKYGYVYVTYSITLQKSYKYISKNLCENSNAVVGPFITPHCNYTLYNVPTLMYAYISSFIFTIFWYTLLSLFTEMFYKYYFWIVHNVSLPREIKKYWN